MFRGRSFFLSVPMLGMAASVACSQPTSPSAGVRVGSPMTLEWFLDRQAGRIMAADTDGDGRVSRAEMDAMTAKGGRDPSQRFDAMDSNRDGYLDKPEIQAALTRRFHRMDRNGDDVLTPDERAAAKERRRPGERAGMPAASQP